VQEDAFIRILLSMTYSKVLGIALFAGVTLLPYMTQSLSRFGLRRTLRLRMHRLLTAFRPHSPRHIVLDAATLGDRNVCIIGDVHGCGTELKEMYELVDSKYGKDKTTFILAGDLVNKGPLSAEVVAFAMQKMALGNTYVIKGNHDDYVAQRYLGRNRAKLGGWEKTLSIQEIDWMNRLPLTISLPSLNSIVVHAGLIPGKDIEDQRYNDMLLMRNIITSTDKDNGELILKSFSKESQGEPWAKVWSDAQEKEQNPLHVYFGHDAKRGLQEYPYATGLDTGCCYGNNLTAIVLPQKDICVIKAHEVYEEPGKKFKMKNV